MGNSSVVARQNRSSSALLATLYEQIQCTSSESAYLDFTELTGTNSDAGSTHGSRAFRIKSWGFQS